MLDDALLEYLSKSIKEIIQFAYRKYNEAILHPYSGAGWSRNSQWERIEEIEQLYHYATNNIPLPKGKKEKLHHYAANEAVHFAKLLEYLEKYLTNHQHLAKSYVNKVFLEHKPDGAHTISRATLKEGEPHSYFMLFLFFWFYKNEKINSIFCCSQNKYHADIRCVAIPVSDAERSVYISVPALLINLRILKIIVELRNIVRVPEPYKKKWENIEPRLRAVGVEAIWNDISPWNKHEFFIILPKPIRFDFLGDILFFLLRAFKQKPAVEKYAELAYLEADQVFAFLEQHRDFIFMLPLIDYMDLVLVVAKRYSSIEIVIKRFVPMHFHVLISHRRSELELAKTPKIPHHDEKRTAPAKGMVEYAREIFDSVPSVFLLRALRAQCENYTSSQIDAVDEPVAWTAMAWRCMVNHTENPRIQSELHSLLTAEQKAAITDELIPVLSTRLKTVLPIEGMRILYTHLPGKQRPGESCSFRDVLPLIPAADRNEALEFLNRWTFTRSAPKDIKEFNDILTLFNTCESGELSPLWEHVVFRLVASQEINIFPHCDVEEYAKHTEETAKAMIGRELSLGAVNSVWATFAAVWNRWLDWIKPTKQHQEIVKQCGTLGIPRDIASIIFAYHYSGFFSPRVVRAKKEERRTVSLKPGQPLSSISTSK